MSHYLGHIYAKCCLKKKQKKKKQLPSIFSFSKSWQQAFASSKLASLSGYLKLAVLQKLRQVIRVPAWGNLWLVCSQWIAECDLVLWHQMTRNHICPHNTAAKRIFTNICERSGKAALLKCSYKSLPSSTIATLSQLSAPLSDHFEMWSNFKGHWGEFAQLLFGAELHLLFYNLARKIEPSVVPKAGKIKQRPPS